MRGALAPQESGVAGFMLRTPPQHRSGPALCLDHAPATAATALERASSKGFAGQLR